MLNDLASHAVMLRVKIGDRRRLELVVVLMQQSMELMDTTLQTLQVGDRHSYVCGLFSVVVCNKRTSVRGLQTEVHLSDVRPYCLWSVVGVCNHFSFRSCI